MCARSECLTITVRQVELSDWPGIKELQAEVRGSKAERFIYVEDDSLEAFFFNSKVFGQTMSLLGLWEYGKLRGMVALFLQAQPQMSVVGCPIVANAFIHSVYISPKASDDAGPFLDRVIMEWARVRNATRVCGNIYPREGRVNAFVKKYGFEPYHTVIGKVV